MSITQSGGGKPMVTVAPSASGGDDAAAVAAAYAAGAKNVALVPGAAYAFRSQLTLGSGQRLWLSGATITSYVASNGGTAAAIATASTGQGTILALAADVAIGARTFTATTKTDLVVGGWVALADIGSPADDREAVQYLKIVSIAGSSNPYMVTVERPLSFAYRSGVDGSSNAYTIVQASTPAVGVEIHGQGATITADGGAARDRALELSAFVDGLVEDLAIVGKFTTGMSMDVGSLRSVARRIRVDGDASMLRVGLASECNEGCTWEDIAIAGVGSGGVGTGFYVFSDVLNRYRNIRVVGGGVTVNGIGVGLPGGSGASPGGRGSVFDACSAEQCATGLLVTDNARALRFVGCSFSYSVGLGVGLISTVSGTPQGVVFSGCTIEHNANDGIKLAIGTDVSIVDSSVSFNGASTYHGLEILAGVTGVSVRGGRWEGNAGYAILAAADVRASGLTVVGPAASASPSGAVQTTGSASAWVSGSKVSTTGTGQFWALWGNSSGTIRVTDTAETLPTSGSVAGLITSSGKAIVRGLLVTAAQFGMYVVGGAIDYDESTDVSASGTPTTGTATTPSPGERHLAP